MAGQAGASAVPCEQGTLTLDGHVLERDGSPIAHVRLDLVGVQQGSAVADEDGYYLFSGLCPGSYQITPVCAAGWQDVELEEDTSLDLTGAANSCDAAAVKVRVLAFVFDPILSEPEQPQELLSTSLGIQPPIDLAEQLTDILEEASDGHVEYDVELKSFLGFPAVSEGAEYNPSNYAACLADEQQCPAGPSYDWIRSTACPAVDEHESDQIWLLGGERFGFAPLEQFECAVKYLDGAEARKLDVIGMDYSRGLSGLLADFHVYSDLVLSESFGSGADGASDPYSLFTQVQAQAPEAASSGCGGPSFAPNAEQPGDFDDLTNVASVCESFSRYPSPLEPQPLSCAAWGCNEDGFRRFWFSHLPTAPWIDDQGRYHDFWRYLVRPLLRAPVLDVNVTCSSSLAASWCSHVNDGEYGTCNSHEWATRGKRTGWVEFLFDSERRVSGVQLYPRACAGLVMSGHLELSDGSSVSFPELTAPSDREAEPVTVTFATKTLSGLRIVIDDSANGTPGFGEIRILYSAP
jgi:hypothetical protein